MSLSIKAEDEVQLFRSFERNRAQNERAISMVNNADSRVSAVSSGTLSCARAVCGEAGATVLCAGEACSLPDSGRPRRRERALAIWQAVGARKYYLERPIFMLPFRDIQMSLDRRKSMF